MQASSCDVGVVVVEGVVVVVLVVLFSCDGNSENSGAVILTFPVVSKKRYGNLKLRCFLTTTKCHWRRHRS